MKKPLAFVLSGGGARGALQVGALRALFEAGYHPDILVGTSIGAANASILGLKGLNEAGLAALTKVYQDSAEQSILSPNTLRLALRALLRRPVEESTKRLHEFYISHG
ncbi:MAG: patatin-like phospholipase family protein, partial [Anaerolineales bacterium]|nr:patatin-like phospholipase family protein [Anaerolineales bacterium]